ncbi:hypothetical protein [Pseudomonas flexibilis]|uniref:Uncharacterized protein n=1 Tax=Pseudomonas flexibilis TaxID=706570 RepID=A0A0B3BK30_9PSED|nr:hypothetical protein [Pseudomonas flexibilis]KHO64808.1 hypothetical protein PT85_11530 [Pseudomonas flexibilis]SCX97302.1 hypothetical protein SAMN02927929_00987 [Pseudomonas flexibilis]
MSELKDQTIEQGVRKRTEYDDARQARLVLNIARSDGGTLTIPLLDDARSTTEQPDLQKNTLLAVLPLARLPGYDRQNEAPKGALPRPGRIYVFWGNRLWRELEADGTGQLFEVDLAHWRKQAEQGLDADERPPVGARQHLILLPMLLQGRAIAGELHMAYSELPWTWEYIAWLEQEVGRIRQRCNPLGPTWSAALVGPERWRATQAMPVIPITRISKGLRARDPHLENLLEDPLLFHAGATDFPLTSLVKQREQRQTELAGFLKAPPPGPLPAFPDHPDLLSEYQLRGYPQLIGVMLEDPLFALRHAVVQSRLAAELLQTLNALVPHQEFGRYAELLYQTVMPAQSPLNELRRYVGIGDLKKATLHDEREYAREQLYQHQEHILRLVERLPPFWNDFQHSHDERLMEPYAQLVELLEILNRSPNGCDPRCIEPEDSKVSAGVNRLTRQLIEATHALTKGLMGAGEELPETARRLRALADNPMDVNAERLGLSSLSLFNHTYAGQNLTLAIDELLNHVANASALAVKRLAESDKTIQVQLHRSFTPSFSLLQKLHSLARRLKLLPQAEALEKNLVVLGAHGDGFSFGLTAAERATMTRTEDYRKASLQGRGGHTLVTSSGKEAERLGFAQKELGKVMVVAAEADDPLLAEYRKWRVGTTRLDTARSLSEGKSLPVLATVFAGFNLYANTVGTQHLSANGEVGRQIFGGIGALADLAIAGNNVALKLLADSKMTTHPWYVFWEQRGFQTTGFWAENLVKRTGGSSLLSYGRFGSAFAMGIVTAGLFLWDAGRALRDGEDDIATAHLVAATGSAIWGFYTIGLLASPWLLGLGVGLLVTGVIGSVLLADGAVEQAIKHGPFGIEPRLPHMNDPLQAYQQLLGALGEPRVRLERLQHWQQQSSEEDRKQLHAALQEARMHLEPNDWAVELSTPLLDQFRTVQECKLIAVETEHRRSDTSGWTQHPRLNPTAKLGPIRLTDNRMLFIYSALHRASSGYDTRPYRHPPTYSLKVYIQLELGKSDEDKHDLFPGYNQIVLPQPQPRQWQAFTPARTLDVTADNIPYWLIAQRAFAK